MIAHYGCFKDKSAVFDACPPCSVLHAACLGFKIDILLIGFICAMGALHCYLTQKITVMHWSEPKSYNKQFELLHSWDLGFRGH